ncbi:hypothetical protein C8F01DRAFT_1161653, partial [Mycena amicta]
MRTALCQDYVRGGILSRYLDQLTLSSATIRNQLPKPPVREEGQSEWASASTFRSPSVLRRVRLGGAQGHRQALDGRKSLVYAMEGYISMGGPRTSHGLGGKKTLLGIGRRRMNEYEATDREPPSPSYLHHRPFARLSLALSTRRRPFLRGTRIHGSAAPHRAFPSIIVPYILHR